MITDRKKPAASGGWSAPLAKDGKPSGGSGSKPKPKKKKKPTDIKKPTSANKKSSKGPATTKKTKVAKKQPSASDSSKKRMDKSKKNTPKKSTPKKKTNNNAAFGGGWQGINFGDKNYVPEKKKIKIGGKEVEIDKPPKTLLLIWILVAARLVFDLVTSSIAFAAFLSEAEECCEIEINYGYAPLAITVPFFILVMLELVLLIRSVMLSLWPTLADEETGEDPENLPISKKIVCCRRWSPKFIMWIVNFLTIVNPWFGLGISWLLMYQSDQVEALTVMGLDFLSIILHFVSVKLENGAETWPMKIMHGSIVIPWIVTVGINAWYLSKGGVCYNSAEELFWYRGCEICPAGTDMEPAIKVDETVSKCAVTTLVNETINGTVVNSTNVTTFEEFFIWDLQEMRTICGSLSQPDKKVCWYGF